MVFSSTFFILMFLPVFLLVYYLTPMRFRSVLILAGSWFFYAWWRVDFLGILIGVTLWNFAIGQRLHRAQQREPLGRTASRLLTIGIIGNIACLGYFKYFNFGLEAWNDLLLQFGNSPWQGWNVVLPIGISFFTFQSVSYLIDVYRRDAKPAQNLIDFAAFIALFPQLIAGPVLRYKDLEKQFIARDHTKEKFLEGVQRFIMGLGKKVLIADNAALIADPIFAQQEPGFLASWLGVIAYTVQLYFDFSGYSCMAIGLGLMMGFRFMENFNTPYRSGSITEFWQRWHISLSTWLRDYLYIPLGGNRGSALKTYRNLGLTMLLGGLWHGAGWTFIIWGAWHGGLLAIERALKQYGLPCRLRGVAGVFLTMILVMIGWTFFRAQDLDSAYTMLYGMFGGRDFDIHPSLWWQLPHSGLLSVGVGIALIYNGIFLRPLAHQQQKLTRFLQQGLWQNWLRYPVYTSALVLITAKLAADSHSPFLYFQF